MVHPVDDLLEAVKTAEQAGVSKKAIQETLRPFCHPGNIPSVSVVNTFKAREAISAIMHLTNRSLPRWKSNVLRRAVLDALDKAVQDATDLPQQGWREDELPELYAALDAHEERIKKRLGIQDDNLEN